MQPVRDGKMSLFLLGPVGCHLLLLICGWAQGDSIHGFQDTLGPSIDKDSQKEQLSLLLTPANSPHPTFLSK